jgi:hypothetical protein
MRRGARPGPSPPRWSAPRRRWRGCGRSWPHSRRARRSWSGPRRSYGRTRRQSWRHPANTGLEQAQRAAEQHRDADRRQRRELETANAEMHQAAEQHAEAARLAAERLQQHEVEGLRTAAGAGRAANAAAHPDQYILNLVTILYYRSYVHAGSLLGGDLLSQVLKLVTSVFARMGGA